MLPRAVHIEIGPLGKLGVAVLACKWLRISWDKVRCDGVSALGVRARPVNGSLFGVPFRPCVRGYALTVFRFAQTARRTSCTHADGRPDGGADGRSNCSTARKSCRKYRTDTACCQCERRARAS